MESSVSFAIPALAVLLIVGLRPFLLRPEKAVTGFLNRKNWYSLTLERFFIGSLSDYSENL